MALVKGMTLSGFEILDIVELAGLDSRGVYARHIKTGAEVFHIVNDDTENTFAFAFKTLPHDSSGVFHIIEHSVLCGSKKYPLKDPFITLAQGSLQTYLNAWTFADKTVYPASSLNEKDYFNLMSVYGDAVYNPNVAEWTFLQEGCRFEFAKGKDGNIDENKLAINGIVYNEMKGAYSALDEYAEQWAVRSVLPDTLYALDSGGDPAYIPRLTYTEFINTYKEYYCPANTLVFLYGNIATEKQLEFLNTSFFEGKEAGKKAPPIPSLTRWTEPRSFEVQSPAGADNKRTVFISWLCNEFNFEHDDSSACQASAHKALALDILSDILIGHDGSPLAKALVSSGLGEDLPGICGFGDELKFHVFVLGLRGVSAGGKKKTAKIEKLIFNELKKLVKKGIPKAEIEAALFSEEFNEREIKRLHQGPWALVLLRRALRGWLHGAAPWQTLLVQPGFERLKAEVRGNPRFFEELIQRELLDNKHRALVTVVPSEDFTRQREETEKKYIHEKENALDDIQKSDIQKKCAELERVQNETDNAALIPHLSLSDLETGISLVPRTLYDAGGIPVVSHKLWTNGITYVTLALPVDVLNFDDYIYLPLFTNCLNALGLPGRHWADVSGELARVAGDFYACLHSGVRGLGARVRATPTGMLPVGERDWLLVHFKTTDGKLPDAFALITRILKEADFADAKRIRNLVEEMRNNIFAGMAGAGSHLAVVRAARGLSFNAGISELWGGISQIDFINKLSLEKVKAVSQKLGSLRDAFARAPAIAGITGENEQTVLDLLEKWGAGRGDWGYTAAGRTAAAVKSAAVPEVFASPSLQTGFAALCVPSADLRTAEAAAETVLGHYLSTGALWKNLRMKGSAYGAACSANHGGGAVCFSTYRDPKPEVSLNALPEITGGIGRKTLTADELEKMIIGVYAKIKEPHSPGKKGGLDFIRFLDGIDDTLRRRRFTHILQTGAGAVEDAAARITECMKNEYKPGICVIAGKKEAEEAAAVLGAEVQMLPV
ncbi:MAG: insulinase family protein [Spirochaetaceae bacterium]|nr:insulinase family protein [Spirochaetaceae bacterium]